VPIKSIIDAIFFTASFEDLSRPTNPVSPNLTVNTELSILDILLGI
jgi:hypothetical protein